MAILTPTMKELVASHQCFVATVNADGTPEVGPKRSTRVLDDERLVFYEVTGGRTWENVRRGSKVAIAVADSEKRIGYRFFGPAEVVTDGPAFDKAARFMKMAGVPAPLKGVVEVRVERIFDLGKGGEEIPG